MWQVPLSSEHPAGPDPLGALSKNKSFTDRLCNILLLVHCIVRRAESGDSWSGSRTNQDEVIKLLNLVKLYFLIGEMEMITCTL